MMPRTAELTVNRNIPGRKMRMKIRQYIEGDYQYTHDLHRENMSRFVDKYWGGWNSDVFRRDVRPEDTWMIEYDGRLAGFFVLTFKEKAHLTNIQISASFRNKGIGSEVLRHCETESRKRGFDALYLEAFLDNRARQLYERLDYKIYRMTNSHYMMKKDLDIKTDQGAPADADKPCC